MGEDLRVVKTKRVKAGVQFTVEDTHRELSVLMRHMLGDGYAYLDA